MNEEEIAALVTLVNAYVAAHRQRMVTPAGSEPKLWASRPLQLEYRAVLDFVRSLDVCARRYAPDSSESLVDSMLTASLRDDSSSEQQVRHFAAILNHDLATRLYVPLEGIAIDEDYSIGAVKVVRMDASAYEKRILEPIAEILHDNPRYNDARKASVLEEMRSRLRALTGRVCAEIPTDVDVPKTLKFANKRAISALCDFLQFASVLFVAHDPKLNIAWAGDRDPGLKWGFAVSDGPAKNWNSMAERIAAGHQFQLNLERIQKLRELGLDRIGDLVGRTAPNEFDEMLQRAVRWYAKGEREAQPDDRKLAYVTVVDLFFAQRGPGATRRICKGFAFVAARNDEAVPAAARYMLNVFGSRSATSHEGAIDLMEADELDRLRWHVLDFVLSIVRLPFRTKYDLREWIREREAALNPEVRKKLDEAIDWRRADAEAHISWVVELLGWLCASSFYNEDALQSAASVRRVLGDSLHAGDNWLEELLPFGTQISTRNECLARRIHEQTVDEDAARAYLFEVRTALRQVSSVSKALGLANE